MYKHLLWRIFGLLMGATFVICVTLIGRSAVAEQQIGCRTFPETGKQICGKFLQYWQTHGGLAQNGYPISGEFREISHLNGNTYTVQYFERTEFELHLENKPPYDVLLTQLGTLRYRDQYGSQEPQNGSQGPQFVPTTPMPIPTPKAGKGVIAGTLGYPSEIIPALDVYALSTNGSRYFSTRTTSNQQDFVINEVEPGTYYVVAYSVVSSKGDSAAAGYTQAALCGLTVQCKDHSLVSIIVGPGQVVQRTLVTDYSPPPGGFPRKP